MKIWAHRGCSQRYPENTITAFKKACEIPGLTGIELDVQLTKDGVLVVIHDEKIDRTTNGTGWVRDYTLHELRQFVIAEGTEYEEVIPTLNEVLDVLEIRMREGMLLNIELKTSVYEYPGIEQKVVELIERRGLEDRVIYSSFLAKSLLNIHFLKPDAAVGMLTTKLSDSLIMTYGLEAVFEGIDAGNGADTMLCPDVALHPHWRDIDYTPDAFEGRSVRAWFTGHLWPEEPTGSKLDLAKLEAQGITDVFLNEPEAYLMD